MLKVHFLASGHLLAGVRRVTFLVAKETTPDRKSPAIIGNAVAVRKSDQSRIPVEARSGHFNIETAFLYRY
jgi:hypothetical protein